MLLEFERNGWKLTEVDFRKGITSKPEGSIGILFLYFTNKITKQNPHNILKIKKIKKIFLSGSSHLSTLMIETPGDLV